MINTWTRQDCCHLRLAPFCVPILRAAKKSYWAKNINWRGSVTYCGRGHDYAASMSASIETGRPNPEIENDKPVKRLQQTFGFESEEDLSTDLVAYRSCDSSKTIRKWHCLIWMYSFYNMVPTLRSSRLATVSRWTPSLVCHIFGLIVCLNFASVGKLFITFDRPLATYQRMLFLGWFKHSVISKRSNYCLLVIIFCLISIVHFVIVKTWKLVKKKKTWNLACVFSTIWKSYWQHCPIR